MQEKETSVKHLSVPVSDELDESIRKRMTEGGFGSMAEYLRHAVRLELERADESKLEKLLLEGLDSGDGVEITRDWLNAKRAELREIARGGSARKRSR